MTLGFRPTPNRWPAAIIALATVFVTGLAASLYWGITRSSRVTDPAYYSRGLTYNSELRACRTGEQRWRLAVSRAGRELVLHLSNSGGEPVTGATAAVTLLAADGTPAEEIPLSSDKPGEYRGSLPAVPVGGQKAWAELRVGDTVLRRTLLLMP